MTITAFLEAAKKDQDFVADAALGNLARNAAKEIEELRDLCWLLFNDPGALDGETQRHAESRVRELVRMEK